MNLMFFSSSWRWIWFSSKWPLLAFDSGMLLHYNEWGDATAAGPTTTRHQSGTFPKKCVTLFVEFLNFFIVPFGTLFVCFNQGFTSDSRWSWCSVLPLEVRLGSLLNDRCHFTVAFYCITMNGGPLPDLLPGHTGFLLPVWTLKERALSNFAF